MSVYAKNLLSFSFALEAQNDVLILEHNKHRSFFSLASLEDAKKTRVWLGPLAPPMDKTKWLTLGKDTLRLEEGISGPVYIAEEDKNPADLFVLSSIDEADGASVLALSQVAATSNMVDGGGNLLVTNTGDQLVAFT